MGLGAEAFTVLAILEARDKASEIFAKIDETLDKFSDTAKGAADTARTSGEEIDQGLGQTASGADKVAAAQERAAAAVRELAAAQKELRDAQAGASGTEDADAAAADRVAAAEQRVTAATTEEATAQKALGDAYESATGKAGIYADAQGKLRDANGKYAASLAESKAATDESGISLAGVGKAAGITAIGLGIAGGLMVKAAGNFQDSTTHLVTDAGESAKNLAMVQAGILNVSTATGTSAKDITNAMYHIESAGYHGAAGLQLLKVAAEGAKVGGADLDTVSKTLVGSMNAYGMSSAHAASFMNQLITTVAMGDMRMQDLASSLSAVAPLAAASGISFAQVGGAIATMTAQGMSARQATQDLANTIRSLSNPNHVAITEMAQLGLSSQDVSKNLGKLGLTGTIEELTRAITSHMGKSGEVLMSAFNQSRAAAQDANTMIQAMPASLQGLAKQFLAGSVSSKQWSKDLQGLSPIQAHLMTQFATTADKAHGFNSLLTSGSPAAQTYTAALAKLMGGATGLNTALMLSGGRMSVFEGNVAAITAAAKKGGSSVDNWSTIQGTFNYKLESAKTAVENTGIAIGTALLPAATSLLSTIARIIEPIAEWTAHNRTLTEVIFVGVTAIAATIAMVALAAKTYKAITGTISDVKKGLQLLGIISKETAATQAASAEEAAGAQVAAAEESAAAEEASAAEASTSWIVSTASRVASAVAGAATTAAAWAASAASGLASGAVWVAESIAKVAIMVAANVAGAAVTAAAWIVANAVMLLGIGLIVAAVIIAVVLIIKYWKQISEFAVKAFHEVLAVVDTVISWIRAHWPLILAILTGPIGLAVLWIVTHWKQVTGAVSAAIDWVRSHWPLLLAILTGPIGLAVLFIVDHFNQIKAGAAHLISDLVGFFERLPGRIISALGDVGHLLWSAGASIIRGLINGLLSQLGALENTASSIVNTIKNFLPFSPAKKGPLSGSGDPSNSGRSIARNLAMGMLSGASYVTAAAHHLAGSAAIGPGGTAGGGLALSGSGGGGYGGGGGAVNVNLYVTGNTVMTERDLDLLVGKIGPVVVRALGQAGVKVRYG